MKFFYTTHTPHQYSSGPDVRFFDLENSCPIESLERAKELAASKGHGTPGTRSYVETTYGVMYDLEENDA